MLNEHDLNCYKAKIDDELKYFDGPRALKEEIKSFIVQAYKAGYAQCEDDFKIGLGL